VDVDRSHPHVHMCCFDPSEVPIVEQVRTAAATTVIVTHHGRVVYITLFTCDGEVCLHIIWFGLMYLYRKSFPGIQKGFGQKD